MSHPISFRMQAGSPPAVLRAIFRAEDLTELRASGEDHPTVLLVRRAEALPSMNAGLINPDEVIAVLGQSDGDAIVLVLEDETSSKPAEAQQAQAGDRTFLQLARMQSGRAPHLAELASRVIELVRGAGVDGKLQGKSNGRWVNYPVNSFTLKVQPFKGNIRFTIYGAPQSYDAGDFLKPDQHGYSAGLINNNEDAKRFARLASEAHRRKTK